jgi:hypothetical protein
VLFRDLLELRELQFRVTETKDEFSFFARSLSRFRKLKVLDMSLSRDFDLPAPYHTEDLLKFMFNDLPHPNTLKVSLPDWWIAQVSRHLQCCKEDGMELTLEEWYASEVWEFEKYCYW